MSTVAGMVIVVVVAALLLAGIVSLIRSKAARRVNGIAMLTALHDTSTAEKQRAIETVVEMKASKKMESQRSGEDEGKDRKDELQ